MSCNKRERRESYSLCCFMELVLLRENPEQTMSRRPVIRGRLQHSVFSVILGQVLCLQFKGKQVKTGMKPNRINPPSFCHLPRQTRSSLPLALPYSLNRNLISLLYGAVYRSSWLNNFWLFSLSLIVKWCYTPTMSCMFFLLLANSIFLSLAPHPLNYLGLTHCKGNFDFLKQ